MNLFFESTRLSIPILTEKSQVREIDAMPVLSAAMITDDLQVPFVYYPRNLSGVVFFITSLLGASLCKIVLQIS